jgi:hypothetical protein
MTNLDELEGLLAKATGRPWCWAQTGDKSNDYVIGTGCTLTGEPVAGRVDFDDVTDFIGTNDIICHEGATANYADPALIVAAVNALPDLLARIRTLEEALRKIEAEDADTNVYCCNDHVWAEHDCPSIARAALTEEG